MSDCAGIVTILVSWEPIDTVPFYERKELTKLFEQAYTREAERNMGPFVCPDRLSDGKGGVADWEVLECMLDQRVEGTTFGPYAAGRITADTSAAPSDWKVNGDLHDKPKDLLRDGTKWELVTSVPRKGEDDEEYAVDIRGKVFAIYRWKPAPYLENGS